MGNPPPLELLRAAANDLIDVGKPRPFLRRRDGSIAISSAFDVENMRSLKEKVAPVYLSGVGIVATIMPFPLSIDVEWSIRVASALVSLTEELRRRLSCSISEAAPEQRQNVSRLLLKGFMVTSMLKCLMLFEKKFEKRKKEYYDDK
jgi:hypothetical protein